MRTLTRIAEFLKPGMFYFLMAFFVILIAMNREALGLPSVESLTNIVRTFFDSYGLWALYIAAVIESLFMISLYFPGSFVVVLAILVSDRSLPALAAIVLIGWASVLTATIINYWLGREGFYRLLLKLGSEDVLNNMQAWLTKRGRLAIFLAGVHPNILAVVNICMGIARAGLAQTLLYSFMAIAFWIPVQVFILGFLLPDPEADTIFLQWIVAAALVGWGMYKIYQGRTMAV